MRPRASISNIAWPAEADEAALDLAADLGFSGIEMAPSKVFGPLDAAEPADLRRYRTDLQARGLAIPALQAILFGVTDAHLFESEEKRQRLAKRLERVAFVASELGAKACVFGSPGLRDPGDLTEAQALSIAADFFGALAPRFAENGSVLAFEANPTIYNCRFVTHTDQALALVNQVGETGFGLQLDTGTVFANSEDRAIVEEAARLASHCHISEPQLAAVGTGRFDHGAIGTALAAAGYDGWISVEMKAADNWRDTMRGAAQVVARDYAASEIDRELPTERTKTGL